MQSHPGMVLPTEVEVPTCLQRRDKHHKRQRSHLSRLSESTCMVGEARRGAATCLRLHCSSAYNHMDVSLSRCGHCTAAVASMRFIANSQRQYKIYCNEAVSQSYVDAADPSQEGCTFSVQHEAESPGCRGGSLS